MIPAGHLIKQLCSENPLPLIMGILNVTPDSFSDGHKFLNPEHAVEHSRQLIKDGADILDIGGESTRPGAASVKLEVELERTIPVISEIRKFSDIPISIDTRKAEVARQAIQAGANVVNDISALRFDSNMPKVLNDNPQTAIILTHLQGEPSTMQSNPQYENVIIEIMDFFTERLLYCQQQGISTNRIILDPGIGFGKSTRHNLIILSSLKEFHNMNLPILLGASRKRFISDVSSSEPDARIGGSLAATQACLESDVEILRVHDVKEHVQFIKVRQSIKAV